MLAGKTGPLGVARKTPVKCFATGFYYTAYATTGTVTVR